MEALKKQQPAEQPQEEKEEESAAPEASKEETLAKLTSQWSAYQGWLDDELAELDEAPEPPQDADKLRALLAAG